MIQKITALLIAGVLVVGLAACQRSSETKTETSTTTEQTPPADQSAPAQPAAPATPAQ